MWTPRTAKHRLYQVWPFISMMWTAPLFEPMQRDRMIVIIVALVFFSNVADKYAPHE